MKLNSISIAHKFRTKKKILSICTVVIFLIFDLIFISSEIIPNSDFEYNNENYKIVNDINEMSSPKASGGIKDFYINLISSNVTTAYLGEDVSILGYATKLIETAPDVWIEVPSDGDEICAIIDGVFKNTIYNTTNSTGYFWLTIPIPFDYDITSNMIIIANTTGAIWNSKFEVGTEIILSIEARLYIESTLNDGNPTMPYETAPSSEYYNFDIEGQVYYYNGPKYSGSSFDLDLSFDNITVFGQISVDSNGIFSSRNTYLRHGYSTYNLTYEEPGDIERVSQVFDIEVIDGIIINHDPMDDSIYLGDSVFITGNITSLTGIPITGAKLVLHHKGANESVIPSYSFDNTDSYGKFSFSIDIEALSAGEYELRVILEEINGISIADDYISGSILLEDTYYITVEIPPIGEQIPLDLIFIIVVAIIAIMGIIFFMRWRLVRQETAWKMADLKGIKLRLKNIDILVTCGRMKEAAAYLYVLYADLAANKFEVEKGISQTSRDYAIIMVKQFGANPMNIYPFIRNIDSVIYGGRSLTETKYREIRRGFGQLYLEITGVPPPEFQEITEQKIEAEQKKKN